MDNQHRKITGYRDLSQAEIDLMNKVKAQGAVLQALMSEVNGHLQGQRSACTVTPDQNGMVLPTPADMLGEQMRLALAEPQRWASIARTHFQEGLMALTRAIAQPSSF